MPKTTTPDQIAITRLIPELVPQERVRLLRDLITYETEGKLDNIHESSLLRQIPSLRPETSREPQPDEIDAAKKLLDQAGYDVLARRQSEEVHRLAEHLYEEFARDLRASGKLIGSWVNASQRMRDGFYVKAIATVNGLSEQPLGSKLSDNPRQPNKAQAIAQAYGGHRCNGVEDGLKGHPQCNSLDTQEHIDGGLIIWLCSRHQHFYRTATPHKEN